MDHTEEIAGEYLQNLGIGPILYEPDGNVPPDFLVDGRIAVEVRRLNQGELIGTKIRGLEETAIPLGQRIDNQLLSMGPPREGVSWYVHYAFSRPFGKWKDIKPPLHKCLVTFRDEPRHKDGEVHFIAERVKLKFQRASQVSGTCFVPGASCDRDAGGFVLEELQKNLPRCIEEKTRKVKEVRHKYPEWWLVFVDYIGYGVGECDREVYKRVLGIQHNWDKVILLNPLNARHAFEI